MSTSRVYSDINAQRDAEYWDYENYTTFHWGAEADYQIGHMIGYGQYSEVFFAINTINNEKCVVKTLKAIKNLRVKREIKILQNLFGGEHIIRLLDVVLDAELDSISLVFDYINNTSYKILYPILTDYDIRYYMFELLKALDFSHANGIMHRDIKPLNVMIDHEKRELRLIDWGLAEFYHPGRKYNTEVASLYYQGPELLVEFEEYDYAVDLWSFGCLFSALIFQKYPLFKGENDEDQLVQIAQVLGTDGLNEFMDKYNITLSSRYDNILGTYERKPWFLFIDEDNKHLATDDALDLMDKLLRYDHQDRLTAKEAQAHPYFAPVREAEARKLLTITSPVKKRRGAYEENKHKLHSYSYCSAYAGPGDVTVTSSVKDPSDSLADLSAEPSSLPSSDLISDPTTDPTTNLTTDPASDPNSDFTSEPTFQSTFQPNLVPVPTSSEFLIQPTSCLLDHPEHALVTTKDAMYSVRGYNAEISVFVLSLVGPALLRLFVLFTCYFNSRIYNNEKKGKSLSFEMVMLDHRNNHKI